MSLTLAIAGAALTAIVGLIAGVWHAARQSARDAAELAEARRRLEAEQVLDEIEQAIAGNDPADNRKELAKWSKR
jgi:HAMP domain-containing protein